MSKSELAWRTLTSDGPGGRPTLPRVREAATGASVGVGGTGVQHRLISEAT